MICVLVLLLGFMVLLVLAFVRLTVVHPSSRVLPRVLQYPSRSRTNNISVALLLCTVNTEERRSMYEDVILWWLDHTPTFDLFIVDSTTNSFHPRIESECRICRFDQTVLPNYEQIKKQTTPLEIYALQQAHNHFASEWSSYTYVIKLTGKYKLPTLHTVLESVMKDDSIDRFVQSIHSPNWQNTELLVVKTSLFQNMLNFLKVYDDGILAEIRFHYYNTYNTKYKRLPKLQNLARYKRSDGKFLIYL